MKRPPDLSPLHSSSPTPPIPLRSLAYSYNSWLPDPISHQISTLSPIVCPHCAILCRILRWYVGLGFDSVKIYCCVPRSVRGWPRSSPIWQPLVSTVQGHLFHAPAHDDLLHSARPQLCVVVGVDSQIFTRYHLSLLPLFDENY